jgi:cobalt-zinc-cadmium efflux system outer membrane protein
MRRRAHGALAAWTLACLYGAAPAAAQVAGNAQAQPSGQAPLGWAELVERFRSRSPELAAGRAQLRVASAAEVTAALRPNPSLSYGVEEVTVPAAGAGWGWSDRQWVGGLEQTIELGGKRRMRIESARRASAVAAADYRDVERQALNQLREHYIGALLAASLAELATEDLAEYDRVIALNRERYRAGDLSRVDLARVELERARFEADSAAAALALRAAKQELLASLDDPTPVEQFALSGELEAGELTLSRAEAQRLAREQRPDLKAAERTREWSDAERRLARANSIADPQIGLGWQRTPGRNALGITVGVPLQIFDRNQGERARTAAEIEAAEAARRGVAARVDREVEAAFDAAESARALLASYQARYLEQARDVYETTRFSYEHGEASLLEFLDAGKAYRDAQVSYRELAARYLSALNQLDTAVGREIVS